jgi:lipopolysaccharide export system ATP-binding protein
MALLEVRGLEKWYGRRQVVNGVEFEVNRGEVVGLLGPNGAGKTTSFRMTIGLITADGGQVIFDGRDVTTLPMYQRARAGMGYLAQDSSVFKQLTVEDNLMAILETRPGLNRRQRKERQDELLDRFGLTKIRRTKANRVSGGERRRLEIARSLITEPKLIMLDEPFAGIDPKTVAEIQDQIRSLVETYHIGILLTDHNIRETLEVTERSYLIREGRVFAYGNPEQIANNPDVRKYYIGDRFDFGHLLGKRHVHSIGESKPGGEPQTPAPAPAPVAPGPQNPASPPALTVPIPTAPAGPRSPAPPRPEVDLGELLPSGAEPPAPPPEPLGSAPPPEPPPFDLEQFLGGSVTVLGDVVIESVDLADDERRQAGGTGERPGG